MDLQEGELFHDYDSGLIIKRLYSPNSDNFEGSNQAKWNITKFEGFLDITSNKNFFKISLRFNKPNNEIQISSNNGEFEVASYNLKPGIYNIYGSLDEVMYTLYSGD